MKNFIKSPSFSTSFSESGKRAKKRFENILNIKAKKTGVLAFLFLICAILVVGTMIVCNNQSNNDKINNEEGADGRASLSNTSTGNIHDYMPRLIAGEAVSDYELLPCLENFTQGIWNELNATYGTDWWNIMLETLRNASVGNKQADSIDQSLRNYYVGKAFLACDGAYTEGLSGIVLKQWEYDRILYSACLAERFTQEEENILRRHLTYSIGNGDNLFGLFIPGSDRNICLDAYPVDFPFGCNLIEKDRKSFRAESFGQVTVVESNGMQATYLTPAEGVHTVITLRANRKNYAAVGITIGDTEKFMLAQRIELKKLDSISYDDEAWFGEYDVAYAHAPKESTKSIVFLIKDGRVSGIELIDGLDGNMY